MTAAENKARIRDGSTCLRCGRSILNYPSSLHHRLPRGMGGGKSAKAKARYDRVSNLVRICGSGTTGCHGHIESYRSAAYDEGWLVHRNEDPETIPLIDLFGRSFFLTDHGDVIAVDKYTTRGGLT